MNLGGVNCHKHLIYPSFNFLFSSVKSFNLPLNLMLSFTLYLLLAKYRLT